MNKPHRLHLVAPTAWPEAPLDYEERRRFVRPVSAMHIAQATQDLQMIEALQAEFCKPDLIDELRAAIQRRADLRFRARVWLAIFAVTLTLAAVAIGYVAHAETASHVAGGVNG